MKTETRMRPSILAVAVTGVFALWLFLEISRWNDSNVLVMMNLASKLRRMYPGIFMLNPYDGFARVIKYLQGSGMIVFAYYLTVMIPDRTDLQMSRWSKQYRITVSVVLALIAVATILSNEYIYRIVFPRSAIVGTFFNTFRYDITMFCCLAGILGLIMVMLSQLWIALSDRKHVLKSVEFVLTAARYVLCIVLAVLLEFMSFQILKIVQYFVPSMGNFHGGNQNWDSVIAAVLCAPILEEILFRGLMLGKMKKVMPSWLALIISSVFFGLWHRNLGQFSYTVFWGMIIGFVFLSTGRVRYCILIHMVGNYLATTLYSSFGKLPTIHWINKLCLEMERNSLSTTIVLFTLSLMLIVCVLWLIKLTAAQTSDKHHAELNHR